MPEIQLTHRETGPFISPENPKYAAGKRYAEPLVKDKKAYIGNNSGCKEMKIPFARIINDKQGEHQKKAVEEIAQLLEQGRE